MCDAVNLSLACCVAVGKVAGEAAKRTSAGGERKRFEPLLMTQRQKTFEMQGWAVAAEQPACETAVMEGATFHSSAELGANQNTQGKLNRVSDLFPRNAFALSHISASSLLLCQPEDPTLQES